MTIGRQRSSEVGLGLAIAMAIVKEHNGRIDVETRISEGTKVAVTLPVCLVRG